MDFISEADTLPPPRKKIRGCATECEKISRTDFGLTQGYEPLKATSIFVTQQVTQDLQMAFDPPSF